MAATIDVVEFEMGGERYAMDIQLAREIVEMIPITPLPRSPDYVAGIINLRGEITTIITINRLIGLAERPPAPTQKIVIMVPAATGGSNAGIIVDDVISVVQVHEGDIEKIQEGIAGGAGNFVKGIIKTRAESGEKKKRGEELSERRSLIIWIDIEKIFRELVTFQK